MKLEFEGLRQARGFRGNIMRQPTKTKRTTLSRRQFLTDSLKTAGLGLALPTILPSTVFGQNAPSNRITVGCIGVGRMGRGDLQDIVGLSDVQVVAVCDADQHRKEEAKKWVDGYYSRQNPKGPVQVCATYDDYRDLLAQADIDAVMVVTPDHWHGVIAVDAARAGKHLFVQKPMTLTIEEGRRLSDTVAQYGVVCQVGSQQRSSQEFRLACEAVRAGRIGELTGVKVGLPTDPSGPVEAAMPIPKTLNYDMWLGPAAWMPYIEKKVHPQNDLGRPGWMRVTNCTWGMICNWGAHHMDIAHWGMGMELTGPTHIKGKAQYPSNGIWDVHGNFEIHYTYPNGLNLICADTGTNKQGVRFEGTQGWVYVKRGKIEASTPAIINPQFSSNEPRLYYSDNHKRNFIDCIKTRSTTIAPAEIGHRSNSACILGGLAMQLGRPLQWDPDKERFVNDDQANRFLSRTQRSPWILA